MISRSEVIDKVLIQIQNDLEAGDLTPVEELLQDIPLEKLIGFLPEEEAADLNDTRKIDGEYTHYLPT